MIWINSKKKTNKGTFKNTSYDWHNWLINNIPGPIKKQWVVLKTII